MPLSSQLDGERSAPGTGANDRHRYGTEASHSPRLLVYKTGLRRFRRLRKQGLKVHQREEKIWKAALHDQI